MASSHSHASSFNRSVSLSSASENKISLMAALMNISGITDHETSICVNEVPQYEKQKSRMSRNKMGRRISRVHFVEYGNVTQEDVQKSDFDWTREIYYLKIYIFRQKRIQRIFTSPVSLNRRRCTESGAIFSIMSLDSTRSVPLSLDRELDGRYLRT